LDGMVHAAVKLNPRQGGAMKSFDASEAMKLRGVSDVVQISGGVGVIADNTWRAFQGADAVVCDWGPAPYPAEMDGHWQALGAAIESGERDSRQRDDGDVEAALGGGALEAEYRAP